jgi:hypothetical protein
MAHFAEISDNTVLQVLVVPDDEEHRGHEYLSDDIGLGGTWIQTSYWTRGGVHYGEDGESDGGTAVRFNYAGLGYTYDPDADAFYPPQPYPSWTLDENFVWQAPSPPILGHNWDEDTLSWVKPDKPYPSAVWNDDGYWEAPVGL